MAPGCPPGSQDLPGSSDDDGDAERGWAGGFWLALRGVNRETGCIVVVRPDQYVSHVLPLHGHEALADFFTGILTDGR